MIILTDEEVAKLREALETTAFKSHDIAKREDALSVLDAAPTVDQVDQQILILGNRWTHCAKELYDKVGEGDTVRAVYARTEVK